MLVEFVLSSIVLLSIFFFFDNIYENEYGQFVTKKLEEDSTYQEGSTFKSMTNQNGSSHKSIRSSLMSSEKDKFKSKILSDSKSSDITPLRVGDFIKKPKFCNQLKSILTNKRFMILMIGASAAAQSVFVFPFICSDIVKLHPDIKENSKYLIFISYYAWGLLSGYITTYMVAKKHNTHELQITELSITILFTYLIFGWVYFISDSNGFFYSTLMVVAIMLNGFAAIGILSNVFDYAIHLTPKIDVSISTGLINICLNLISLAIISVQYILEANDIPQQQIHKTIQIILISVSALSVAFMIRFCIIN